MHELTMSSREITALTGKKHYNVMRDIENLAAQLEVDISKFSSTYTDSQNREQTEYLLDIETCLCLVAGYDAKQRMKIIKRLIHEKELTKKDNGKSIYGASIKQVNQVLNSTYTWQPLKKYCEENHMELEYIFPYGYGSLAVAVYPYNAWLDVYEIDLNLIFKDFDYE